MKINIMAISLAALMSLASQINAQPKKNIVNYLGISGPVIINKSAFQLIWSSHPNPSLYKQEYLPIGDAFPNYQSMVTIDFVVSESTVDQAVAVKISELEQLKKTGHDVNFEVIGNKTTGEKIVDCLIGQKAINGQESLIERDVYRFKLAKAKSGEQGILLFAVSIRKYGKDIKPFLLKLKTDKPVLVSEIAKFQIPELTILKK